MSGFLTQPIPQLLAFSEKANGSIARAQRQDIYAMRTF